MALIICITPRDLWYIMDFAKSLVVNDLESTL